MPSLIQTPRWNYLCLATIANSLVEGAGGSNYPTRGIPSGQINLALADDSLDEKTNFATARVCIWRIDPSTRPRRVEEASKVPAISGFGRFGKLLGQSEQLGYPPCPTSCWEALWRKLVAKRDGAREIGLEQRPRMPSPLTAPPRGHPCPGRAPGP